MMKKCYTLITMKGIPASSQILICSYQKVTVSLSLVHHFYKRENEVKTNWLGIYLLTINLKQPNSVTGNLSYPKLSGAVKTKSANLAIGDVKAASGSAIGIS